VREAQSEAADPKCVSIMPALNATDPHEALSDLTPMAAEELHYAAKNELMPTG
jgi:hypothetical protein